MLTDILRCTKVEHDMSIASAEGHNGLRVAGSIHILPIGVGCHAQNLLWWQARGILRAEGTATPAVECPPLSSTSHKWESKVALSLELLHTGVESNLCVRMKPRGDARDR